MQTSPASVPSGFFTVPVMVTAIGDGDTAGRAVSVVVGRVAVGDGVRVGTGVAGRGVAVGATVGVGEGDGVGAGVSVGVGDGRGTSSCESGATGSSALTMRSVSRSTARTR